MRACYRFLAAIAVASAAVSTSAHQTVRQTEATLLGLIKERVESKRNVGIVVGVIEPDGRRVIASYGDPGPGALPLDRESVFEIGSITKVFTTTLLADMVRRGEVSLDDPVAKFLPASVRMPSRNGRLITVNDLATHASGLPRLMTNLAPADPRNPYADYTVEQLYAFLNGYELTRDVGAQYEYSNLGMGLLGHALALRRGASYEVLVTERVLKPLGMRHTSITLDAWMTKHLARGHDNSAQPAANWDVRTLEGAGALRSTMDDMLTFTAANLKEGSDQLSRAMTLAQTVRAPTGRPDLSIALGWHVRTVGGNAIVWHNGGTGGYRTWMGFDKRRRIAAVVLTNSTHGADDLGYELLK
jgi:CubicO group peptidase (beta-lactamase class C family)